MEMKNWLERTELLVKSEGIEKLKSANILVVGLGGVGSFAAEFIARSGVGKMTIVDGDSFDVTNIKPPTTCSAFHTREVKKLKVLAKSSFGHQSRIKAHRSSRIFIARTCLLNWFLASLITFWIVLTALLRN
ncbi:hypothetical protein CCAN11_2320034 [Capnocytophaga canimorsus]|uniref:THIF-type NAD/FAD binding fold domain-containing protein n=1 Tax=Capnocytophaga canimorsus TaxID=28188 RepID=A0A0B7II47_9FLAO|nr:hypothetical protein CCAN11_2320034 [Capnocytophaga canimorsus]